MKKLHYILPALLSIVIFGCSTSGISKVEATNDLLAKICGTWPDSSQPKVDLYMLKTGEWKHGVVRCQPSQGVSPDNVVIPFKPVPAASIEKPLAILLLNHESGDQRPFPIELAGALTKLEGGKRVQYVRNDPSTPSIQYTAYIY